MASTVWLPRLPIDPTVNTHSRADCTPGGAELRLLLLLRRLPMTSLQQRKDQRK